MDLTDIYRKFQPIAAAYTLFSVVHRTFSQINNILGHKATLNQYNKIETTFYILSDPSVIKQEINSKKQQKIFRHMETE
jgi:hypothetical protein